MRKRYFLDPLGPRFNGQRPQLPVTVLRGKLGLVDDQVALLVPLIVGQDASSPTSTTRERLEATKTRGFRQV